MALGVVWAGVVCSPSGCCVCNGAEWGVTRLQKHPRQHQPTNSFHRSHLHPLHTLVVTVGIPALAACSLNRTAVNRPRQPAPFGPSKPKAWLPCLPNLGRTCVASLPPDPLTLLTAQPHS